MLDMSESWDALVRRHAPDPVTAKQILANPLYAISPGASPRATTTSRWSVCTSSTRKASTTSSSSTRRRRSTPSICSTPLHVWPSSSPRGCSGGSSCPYRSRLVNLASRPFYQVADRILGSQFLEDLAGFFILFQTMRDGFVARAEAVSRLLQRRAHDLRRRDHARGRAGRRRPAAHREASRAPPASRACSSATRCCRARFPNRRSGAVPRCSDSERARSPSSWLARLPVDPVHRVPPVERDGRPRARRGGSELRQLPSRCDT